MAEAYVGEIRMFAGNFAPVGWALCHGQQLQIAEHELLFMLIGTTYGGDGQTYFSLPDLRGRVPIHRNKTYVLGMQGGVEQVILSVNQMPMHTHPVQSHSGEATVQTPEGAVWASSGLKQYAEEPATSGSMYTGAISSTGLGQPHSNMMPFMTINFIIALEGIFPANSN